MAYPSSVFGSIACQLKALTQTAPLPPGRHTVLKLKQVVDRTRLSRSTIYNRVKDGSLAQPINLGGNSVGWLLSDVEAFLAGREGAKGGEA